MGGYDVITAIMVQLCPFFSLCLSLGFNRFESELKENNQLVVHKL